MPTVQSEFYTKEEVQQILDSVYFEAEKAIDKAFDDGYKQGVLEYAPKIYALENFQDNLEKESKNLKRNQILIGTGCCIGGIAGGFLLGFLTRMGM